MTKPLGNVLRQIKTGSTPRTSHPEYFSGDIPWFTPSDIGKTKNLTKSSRTISGDGVSNGAAKLFSEGTVLVTCIGEIGRVGILRQRSSANQQITALIFDETVLPDYAYYWFIANPHQLRRFANQAIVPILNNERLQEVPFSFPADKKEQTRIIAQLDKSDSLVRTRRYALELTDTLLPAAFRQLFGARLKAGPFRALGELVKITGGGTPAREHPEFYQGRIPWLTSKDMKGDYIWDTEEHITEKAIQESATNLVPAGSILVVVKSKVLMHRLPVATARVPLCHGQDIKSIQCSGTLQPAFARFVIKFHEGRLLNLARGANTEGLTLPMLEELPVPTVPSCEQEYFAELVARHECLRAAQREALRQAEHLFASLLARAFGTDSPSEPDN
jgi:type I restriction enzyme, S subunit